MEFTKEGRKIRVKASYGEPVVSKLKDENFKWNHQEKVWEKGYTKVLWQWLEEIQSEKKEFANRMTTCKESGLLLKHYKSYDCRERIKGLGGVWDKLEKGWVMPSEAAYKAAFDACDHGVIKSTPKPKAEKLASDAAVSIEVDTPKLQSTDSLTRTVKQIVEECWECGATYASYGNVEAGRMGCRRC